jgi:hypothetical protein
MTVTCMETNESIVFEYDANNKKADINIGDIDLNEKSELIEKALQLTGKSMEDIYEIEEYKE